MDRITVTITSEQHEEIQELVSSGEYESKSEAVRELLKRGHRTETLEERIEELERERQILIENVEENGSRMSLPPDSSLLSRIRWLLFGYSDDR